MAAQTNFWRLRAALLGAALVAARPAHAEAPTTPDSADEKPAPARARWSPSNPYAPGVWPTTLSWRNTFFYLGNSASTQTLGVGRAYQSRNPYYDLTIGLRPKLYLFENKTGLIGVYGDLGLTSERTNSDSTTQRGQWSATDFELWGEFAYTLREGKGDATELEVRVPALTLPTSRVSYDTGKILGLGVRTLLAEDVLLAGRESAFFPNILFGVRAEYGYQFTRGQVPTNSSLERIRLDPDGHSVLSDQLGGASFAAHSALFGLLASLYVHQNVAVTSSLAVRPAWHYPVRQDVEVCGVVLTGCATPGGTADPQTRTALTSFGTDVLMSLSDVVGLSVGYANLSAQIGPDGRRRSVFYSPDARFYAQLNIGLDQLYVGVSPRHSSAARGARDLHRF